MTTGMTKSISTGVIEIGVDIGGTFTDVVAIDGTTGVLHAAKVLTDYEDLARGVISGVRKVIHDNHLDASSVTRLVHGTTLVTNSLLERRGPRTALITTAGFGDVLDMARESRFNVYDIDIELPVPLVARDMVFEISERLDHGGKVVTPLSTDEVESLVLSLRGARVQSIGICLLHSYANDRHEQRLRTLLQARLPGVTICISAEIVPDLREYERASTTIANAYVQPVLQSYLSSLQDALAHLCPQATLLIMTSDGGLVEPQTAIRFPVRLIESGPAGGAIATAFLGQATGLNNLIAYDMGGTTAKLCIVESGKPLTTNVFEFGRTDRFARGSGLPLQIPVIEMIEIGAGGGSIAGVNRIGMLQIGPQSTNAAPGPACYDLGGSAATVTDADLVLGYLAADSFLGGAMRLNVERARAAIEAAVAVPLGQTIEQAAHSIYRVVNANMARAAKMHCLEHGKDVRQFDMLAYGGAGPVHACGVGRLLGVREIIYPPRAGVLSAFGFLVADPSFELVHGGVTTLLKADLDHLNDMLASMQNDASAVVRRSLGAASKALTVKREVALRYEGQSFELYVPLGKARLDQSEVARILELFATRYSKRYQIAMDPERVEAVRWRLRVSAPDERVAPRLAPTQRDAAAARKDNRPVYVPEAGRFLSCPVYDRYALAVGVCFDGPAIIEEIESTVFIGASTSATVLTGGELKVSLHPLLPERTP